MAVRDGVGIGVQEKEAEGFFLGPENRLGRFHVVLAAGKGAQPPILLAGGHDRSIP